MNLLNSRTSALVIILSLVLASWWLKINLSPDTPELERFLFNGAYSIIPILGFINSLIISHKHWGGLSSHIGKTIFFLGLGLLSQSIGLLTWTYYNLTTTTNVPYPSLADIGYFGLIPLYTIALLNLFKANGAIVKVRTLPGILQITILPLLVMFAGYLFFLKQVGIDPNQPLKTLLDISYPLGEALLVSLALLNFTLSKGILGGKMRPKIEFVVIALIFQSIAEFTFIYMTGSGTLLNAGFSDILYLLAYTTMTLAIVSFNKI